MKLRLLYLFASIFSVSVLTMNAQLSKSWNPDNGNGTYTNPIIYADYSDPDVCRVGDDFYMTSSSFNCFPGLQILHSRDLIHWRLIGTALPDTYPDERWKNTVQHGNGVWAPSIRFHQGEYYIYFGDPDIGIFMTKASRPEGPWSDLHLVKAGKGLIDSCPFWDEDGNAYLVHGVAGSRAGFKSVLCMAPMSPDGTHLLASSRIIFDGHEAHPTVEGPKMYKRNGYYYIFAPAGGVSTGWQLVLRSKNPFGPYDQKVVMAQGTTDINGPHQGAWVDTPQGENWFLHFQDLDAYGRVVLLEPMVWKNDWPVIGVDADGDGCGEPVRTYRMPSLPKRDAFNPAESDEFTESTLGLQWQWQGIPNPLWTYTDSQKKQLRMYSVPLSVNYRNLSDCSNLLLQKFPAESFTVTTLIHFHPNPNLKTKGERCGLVVMGEDYASLSLTDTPSGFVLSQEDCLQALKGNSEKVKSSVVWNNQQIYFRLKVSKGGICQFSYSENGKRFTEIGAPFTAKPGRWIGAKVGLFVNRPQKNNDGGWIDVDWFRLQK